jgi:signal transduction histidine kinase
MISLADLYEKLRKAVITRHYGPEAADTERWQAIVRLWIASAAAIYLVVSTLAGALPVESRTPILLYIVVFMLVAVLVYGAIVRWPAPHPARLVFSIANDYVAMTFILIMGGAVALPVAVVLLWVAIGTGVRYGSRYLVAANILAVLSLVATVSFTPYWQENPYVFAAMFLLLLLTPSYAQLLVIEARVAHEAALQANLAKTRFLAQASHDLRQPVHAISLFTACLRDSDLGKDEQQMVDNIDRSLQSVSRLFRSLLDISTLDSGKVRPRIETVAIGELLQEVMDQNSEAARWAGVTIKLVPTKRHVRVDPNLITTMVQNIISNALKYAPRSPVLIGCRRRGKTLSIAIHDRGRGIPDEERAKVFEEFYRVPVRGRDVEGVGLGLSIVKRMTNLMGLAVSIRSKVGRGTTVFIDGLQITAGEKSSPSLRPSPVTPLAGMQVLLIEDDKDVLLATTTLLEKWGCKVQPEVAVPAEPNSCDLIITDFDLNGPVTGADSIEHIRRLLGQEIPAVVMTGHDENRVRQILDDGEIPVLSKPVRPAELRSALVAQKLNSDRPDIR